MFRFARPLLAGCAVLSIFSGAAKAPDFAVRFFIEASEHDTDRFASPFEFQNPPRKGFIEKTPIISERNIRGIYAFEAPDGSWGCLFKLDETGRINLATASQVKKGTSLVVFAGTKKGTHQIIDMLIDKPVEDGIITVQHGLTNGEVAMLRKNFRTISPSR